MGKTKLIIHMTFDHKTLTRSGYILRKDKMSKREIAKVKSELEVMPEANPDYAVDVEPFRVYGEDADTLSVPRYYGVEHFGKPEHVIPMNGNKINITFNGALRDNQKPVIEKCLESIRNDGGGIISLPCGKIAT